MNVRVRVKIISVFSIGFTSAVSQKIYFKSNHLNWYINGLGYTADDIVKHSYGSRVAGISSLTWQVYDPGGQGQ